MLFNYNEHKELLEQNHINNGKEFCDILKNILIYVNSPKIVKENGIERRKYTVTINNFTSFSYFEGINLKHNNEERILNALWCLLFECVSIQNISTVEDFMREYGYEDYKEANRIMGSILNNKAKLLKFFKVEQLETLLKCYDENHW